MNKPFFTLNGLAVALSFSSFAIAENTVELPAIVIYSKYETGSGNTLSTTHLKDRATNNHLKL